MRAKTFNEVLEANRQARRAVVKKAELLDLSHIDFDAIANSIIREAAREAELQKAAKTAVSQREELIATYIHANPAETRANAAAAVYAAHPGLYERCRREETVDGHGRARSEIYDRVTVVGIEKSETESAAAEVERRVEQLVAKTAGSTTQ